MEIAKGCYLAQRGKTYILPTEWSWVGDVLPHFLKNGGNRNILKSNLLWNVSLSLSLSPSPSLLLPFLSLPSAGNMFCRAPVQQFCDRNSITLVTRPAKLNKQRWGIWQCGSLLFCLQRKSIFFICMDLMNLEALDKVKGELRLINTWLAWLVEQRPRMYLIILFRNFYFKRSKLSECNTFFFLNYFLHNILFDHVIYGIQP